MTEGNGRREPATPQEIREILRDVSATKQETVRRMQETDQLLKRQAQETDRRLRGLDELFNGQWGNTRSRTCVPSGWACS